MTLMSDIMSLSQSHVTVTNVTVSGPLMVVSPSKFRTPSLPPAFVVQQTDKSEVVDEARS